MHEIVRTAASYQYVTETVLNNLWYTIPFHVRLYNTSKISTVFHVHTPQNLNEIRNKDTINYLLETEWFHIFRIPLRPVLAQ